MRNPWGNEKYFGEWSDTDPQWSPFLQEQAGMISANDGEFFMPIESYVKYFEYTSINFNVDDNNLYRTSFLKINDDTINPGWTPWCGNTCTQHALKFVSNVDQKVIVSVQTWDARSMPDTCKS